MWKVLFLVSAHCWSRMSPHAEIARRTTAGRRRSKTGIKPPSITDPPAQAGPLHWLPAERRCSRTTTIPFSSIRPPLQGFTLIQRPESVANRGRLPRRQRHRSLARHALIWHLLCENNDILTRPRTTSSTPLAGDGWTRVPGIFSSSEPESQHWSPLGRTIRIRFPWGRSSSNLRRSSIPRQSSSSASCVNPQVFCAALRPLAVSSPRHAAARPFQPPSQPSLRRQTLAGIPPRPRPQHGCLPFSVRATLTASRRTPRMKFIT